MRRAAPLVACGLAFLMGCATWRHRQESIPAAPLTPVPDAVPNLGNPGPGSGPGGESIDSFEGPTLGNPGPAAGRRPNGRTTTSGYRPPRGTYPAGPASIGPGSGYIELPEPPRGR